MAARSYVEIWGSQSGSVKPAGVSTTGIWTKFLRGTVNLVCPLLMMTGTSQYIWSHAKSKMAIIHSKLETKSKMLYHADQIIREGH